MKKLLLTIGGGLLAAGAFAQIPSGYEVLISGDTSDGTSIVEWVDEMENGTEDGRECIIYTNSAAGNSYGTQLAFDMNYAPETTYYITFDVIGDPSDVAIGAWFQHKDGYKTIGGYNTFNTFKVTSDSEWTQVVLKGTYSVATSGDDEGLEADRVAINLGEYVGTMYMTNFKVYGPGDEYEPPTSGEGSFNAPEGYGVVLAGDTSDGNLIVEWKDELENGLEDGRECIIYTNTEATDSYSI